MAITSSAEYIPDQELIAFRQGNRQTFARLYDRYASILLGIIEPIVVNHKIAEEVLQKTFVEIWEKRNSFDISKDRLFNWMFTIARRLALCNVNPAERITGASIPAENNAVDKNESSAGDERAAFNLIYFKGYSFADAAARLNIPVNILKQKLIVAIKQLKGKTVA